MITPVTDRTAGAHMAHTDMERVAKNLNELAGIMNSRGYMIPAGLNEIYLQADILTREDWDAAVGVATAIASSIDLGIDVNDELGWQNINAIESLTLAAYEAMAQTVYPLCGDGLRAGVDFEEGTTLKMTKAPDPAA